MKAETFYIGQEFEDTYPEMADLWCHANNAHIIQIGTKYIIVSNESMPLPTKEDIKLFRANAYLLEVDPITAHISRLRDEEQTEEIKQEIEDLIAERSEKVLEIKAQFPYPEEEIVENKDEDTDSI